MKRLLFPFVVLLFLALLPAAALAVGETDQPLRVECQADIPEVLENVKEAFAPGYTFFVSHSQQKWVGTDNMEGDVSRPCSDKEVGNSHGRFGAAWQSNGFARYVFYYIFGTIPHYDYHCNPASLNGAAVVVARYASPCASLRGDVKGEVTERELTGMFLAKAKPGDLIVLAPKGQCKLKGVSMVLLEARDAGVMVYHADYTGQCAVTEDMIPYSALADYHCVTLLRAANYPAKALLPARSVSQLTLSATDLPLNENLTLNWLPGKYAADYAVTLVPEEGQADPVLLEASETAASFSFEAPGVYHVEVVSRNSEGSSEPLRSESFTVHPDCQVDFLNYDGTLISSQSVPYGSAATAPTVPERTGYKFAGWDKGFTEITQDTEVTAQYQIETYAVSFYSVGKNRRIGSVQMVEYGSSAVIPENIDNCYEIDEECVFSGWHVEFGSRGTDPMKVDGDMTLIATQSWRNEGLPIQITLDSAILKEDGKTYSVTGTVKNTGDEPRSFKLLATLKTSNDKAVKCVILADRTLAPGESQRIGDTVVYGEKISSIEYVAVGIKGDSRTGGAWSELTSVPISASKTWGAWSEWYTPEEVTGSHDDMERKTQYRYRNKVRATSSTKNWSSPWVFENETYTYGSWSGWSGWQSSPISGSDTVSVETRWAYLWFYYQCPYCGHHSHYKQDFTWGGGCGNWIGDEGFRNTWGPDYAYGTDWGGTGRNVCYWTDAGQAYCWASGYDTYSQFQYRCQTRAKIYTYHYWKWGEWSEWSDTYQAGDQTQTRELVRYRDEVAVSDPNAGQENTNGGTYEISGTIQGLSNVDLSGRRATIMVYKRTNSDPTEAQLEYVGQTTLGEGNSYSFTVRPREYPVEETGDFVVALGIEGCDKLVNVHTIPAEHIYYMVKFIVDGQVVNQSKMCEFNEDGSLKDNDTPKMMEGEYVRKGASATLPDTPVKEGYSFVRWSASTTDVQSPMEVYAVFTPNEYTVTFIDWETGTLSSQRLLYGEEILYPALENVPGYTSRRWKGQEEHKTAAGNLVVETEAVPATYTVEFARGATVLFTQEVAYGQAAHPPLLVINGMVSCDWTGPCSYKYITQDATFQPVYLYKETAAAPEAEVTDAGDGKRRVALSCETEGATIYYRIEEHPGGTDASLMEADDAIMDLEKQMDLIYARTAQRMGGGDAALQGSGDEPAPYDFFDDAVAYAGEPLILRDDQTLVFRAKADSMNDSVPVTESADDGARSYTAEITKNTLRHYRESVEGELRITLENRLPSYEETLFVLCLYDERGVMVDFVPLKSLLGPGPNEIVFPDIVIPVSAEQITARLVCWTAGQVAPVLPVQTFAIP